MSQNFENLTLSDYIDTGINILQERDLTALTWMSGNSFPTNPIQNAIYNHLEQKKIYYYNGSSWVLVLDYSVEQATESMLQKGYQPLNVTNLTGLSNLNPTSFPCFFNNSQTIPFTTFIRDKLLTSASFKSNIGLGEIANLNIINTGNIANNSIPIDKFTSGLFLQHQFETGDIYSTYNPSNKSGFIKLTKNTSIGGATSSATYKGETYRNLYYKFWGRNDVSYLDSSGNSTNKGSNNATDFNTGKSIVLPEPPNTIITPVNKTIFNSSTPGSYTLKIDKAGWYYVTMVGGGGGSIGCVGDWSYALAGIGKKSGYATNVASGGSASCFSGGVYLYAETYKIVVGKGGTSTVEGNVHDLTQSCSSGGDTYLQIYNTTTKAYDTRILTYGGGSAGSYDATSLTNFKGIYKECTAGVGGGYPPLTNTTIAFTEYRSSGTAGSVDNEYDTTGMLKTANSVPTALQNIGYSNGSSGTVSASKDSYYLENGKPGLVKITYMGDKQIPSNKNDYVYSKTIEDFKTPLSYFLKL